jgi:hypothetical protein
MPTNLPPATNQCWSSPSLAPAAAQSLAAFLRAHQVATLNVAGHRVVEGQPDWQDLIEEWLVGALK